MKSNIIPYHFLCCQIGHVSQKLVVEPKATNNPKKVVLTFVTSTGCFYSFCFSVQDCRTFGIGFDGQSHHLVRETKHPPTHSPTHPLTHSPTHPLTYSPTHPPTHPLTYLHARTHSHTSPRHALTHILTSHPPHTHTPTSHSLRFIPAMVLLSFVCSVCFNFLPASLGESQFRFWDNIFFLLEYNSFVMSCV